MSAFSIILGFIFILSPFNLLNLVAVESQVLQQLCISRLSQKTEYSVFTKAIVCGSTLPDNAFNQQLKSIGLIHLIVVSGSHLIFLSEIINKIPFRHVVIRYIVLFMFSLITGFQAPVVRALIHQILNDSQNHYKLNWSKPQTVWNASLLCLALNPAWINSISFLLSWAASLALSLVEKPEGFKKHVLFFVLFLPLLAFISTPNPVSILSNWLLAPLVGMVLFPVSLLSMILGFLNPLVELMWYVLDCVSLWVSRLPLSYLDLRVNSSLYLWIYIWALHFITHHTQVLKEKCLYKK